MKKVLTQKWNSLCWLINLGLKKEQLDESTPVTMNTNQGWARDNSLASRQRIRATLICEKHKKGYAPGVKTVLPPIRNRKAKTTIRWS